MGDVAVAATAGAVLMLGLVLLLRRVRRHWRITVVLEHDSHVGRDRPDGK